MSEVNEKALRLACVINRMVNDKRGVKDDEVITSDVRDFDGYLRDIIREVACEEINEATALAEAVGANIKANTDLDEANEAVRSAKAWRVHAQKLAYHIKRIEEALEEALEEIRTGP